MNGLDWTKIAGLLAIAAGAAVMYYPPTLLGTGAGTVAFATALVTAGFGALGVPIAATFTQARARGAREADLRANRSAGARRGAATRARGRAPAQPSFDAAAGFDERRTGA